MGREIICTIAICTYRRAYYLNLCLEALIKQWKENYPVKILVIDNANDTATREVVAKHRKGVEINYLLETITGLSHARNRALRECHTEWICYLDDDAIPHPNFIERLVFNIYSEDCDAFGGMFFPWYEESKPKWIPDWFGLFRLHYIKERRVMQADEFFPGGICAFKSSILQEVGGFPVDIGMRGNTIGYGEEDVVQVKLREKNYRLVFDPEWKIDHLVADYKQKVAWHLKRSFAKGRDEQIIKGATLLYIKLLMLLRICFLVPVFLFKNLAILFTKKSYYKENFLLDTFGHASYLLGKLSVSGKTEAIHA
jgi:glycosyltransferase involved in cell wall biosynthesis